jgi:hypothetical protein
LHPLQGRGTPGSSTDASGLERFFIDPSIKFCGKTQMAKRKNDFENVFENVFPFQFLIRSLTSIIFVVFFVFFFFLLLNHLEIPLGQQRLLSTRFALVVIVADQRMKASAHNLASTNVAHEMVRPWSTRMKRQSHPSGSMIAQCVFVEEICQTFASSCVLKVR